MVLERTGYGTYLKIYGPSFAIVAVSWFALWLDKKRIAPRFTIQASCIVALTTQWIGIYVSTPTVSYIRAIDFWLITHLGFVVAVFIAITSSLNAGHDDSQPDVSKEAVKKEVCCCRTLGALIEYVAKIALPVFYVAFAIMYWSLVKKHLSIVSFIVTIAVAFGVFYLFLFITVLRYHVKAFCQKNDKNRSRDDVPEDPSASSDDVPNDTSAPSDDLPKETRAPSDDVPKDTSAPSDDVPKDTSALSDDVQKDTTAPNDDVQKNSSALSDDVLKDTSAPSDNMQIDTSAPSDGVQKDTSAPSNDVPKHTSAPSNDVPKDTSAPSNDVPKHTSAPSDGVQKDTSAPSNGVPKDTSAPSNDVPKDTSAQYDGLPKDTSAPSDDVPTS